MYSFLVLLFLFLGAVFSVLLYFKNKKERQYKLDNGECPSCNAKFKTFKDENTGAVFKVDVIKTRVIKNHGCSGIIEMEYVCSSCGLREIHNSVGQGCAL